MKKTVMILCCLLTTLASFAQGSEVVVEGELDDLLDSMVILVMPGLSQKGGEAPVAKTMIKDRKFSVGFHLDGPRFMVAYCPAARVKFTFLTGPGETVRVSGVSRKPTIVSPLQQQFEQKFVKPRAAIDSEYARLYARYNEVVSNYGKAYMEKDTAEVKRIEALPQYNAYKRDKEAFGKRYEDFTRSLVSGNNDTFWGPMLMLMNTTRVTPCMEPLYNMFTDNAKNSYYGRLVADQIYGIQGMAPDFKLADCDGKEHSLKQVVSANKFVLLDFWASWCAPCRAFLPRLKQLAKEYEGKGLAVLSISIDQSRDKWLKALDEEQMWWLNLHDQYSVVAGAYQVNAIPAMFLVGSNGKVIFSNLYGDEAVKRLKEAIDK